eukprot:SM000197S05472  [mRNA]  locus=s197:101492:105251:- [translate_table: standard]
MGLQAAARCLAPPRTSAPLWAGAVHGAAAGRLRRAAAAPSHGGGPRPSIVCFDGPPVVEGECCEAATQPAEEKPVAASRKAAARPPRLALRRPSGHDGMPVGGPLLDGLSEKQSRVAVGEDSERVGLGAAEARGLLAHSRRRGQDQSRSASVHRGVADSRSAQLSALDAEAKPGRPRTDGRPRAAAAGTKAGLKRENAPREARHRTPALAGPASHNPRVEVFLDMLRQPWPVKRTVAEVLDELHGQLTRHDIVDLLNELQRRHDWRRTLELFHWMKKQPWHVHNSRLYTSLIGFLGRERQPDLATLLFQEMLLERCEPNHYTYTALINAYGRARKFDDALAVFEHMKSSKEPDCRPNTVTCNALIGALCKGQLYDAAIEVFFDMRKERNGLGPDCQPNVVTYNVLIDSLCREGQVEAAVNVLHDMRSGRLDEEVQPNVVTYNTIIDACGKLGLYQQAETLAKEMNVYGMSCDTITYTALIDAYGKGGLHERAEATFLSMQAEGIHRDVLTYTALIAAYGKVGLHDKADTLFQDMLAHGIEPNQVTYLALIDSCGKFGLHQRAEVIFQEMQGRGCDPNVYTFSALLDAYGKSSLYKEAAHVFEQMRLCNCRPNLITYAALLAACSRCTLWDEALTLLYCLQHSGSEFELAICRLMIGSSGEKGLWENAARMLETVHMQPWAPRLSFYNALLDGLWSFGQKGRAARVLAAARAHAIYPEKQLSYSSSEWSLDLHDLSVGASLSLLHAWLEELQAGWQWTEATPDQVRVITGWGKHSKTGDSQVKAAVETELRAMSSPFAEMAANSGSLASSGDAVKAWLQAPKTQGLLVLADSPHPRPKGELPYEEH